MFFLPFRHIVFLLFSPERPMKPMISMTFCLIVSISLRLQLYGEYREQLGNFARREAARLLTERQWRRHAGDTAATARKGHGRRHHHPVTLESHHSHASSTKKPRTYSKCQGGEFTCLNAHFHASRRWKLQWRLMWYPGISITFMASHSGESTIMPSVTGYFATQWFHQMWCTPTVYVN